MLVPVLEKQEDGAGEIPVKRLNRRDSRCDFSDPRKIYDKEKGTYVYLTSISHLRLARSKDRGHFTVDEKPFIRPGTGRVWHRKPRCNDLSRENPW